jgi:hypothetical protein
MGYRIAALRHHAIPLGTLETGKIKNAIRFCIEPSTLDVTCAKFKIPLILKRIHADVSSATCCHVSARLGSRLLSAEHCQPCHMIPFCKHLKMGSGNRHVSPIIAANCSRPAQECYDTCSSLMNLSVFANSPCVLRCAECLPVCGCKAGMPGCPCGYPHVWRGCRQARRRKTSHFHSHVP